MSKIPNPNFPLIPAQAGIQSDISLDSRLRGSERSLGGMCGTSTSDILPPHLVPLPMGEETSSCPSVNDRKHNVVSTTLASPIGRGARQRVRGWDAHSSAAEC